MKQLFSRYRSDDRERGAVTFLVAITVIIVMLAGAIAVDLSATATRGQSLQNAVDSAALAGVQAYRQSIGNDAVADEADEAAARAAVQALLVQNGIEGLTAEVSFPDQVNFTEVTVSLRDPDTGLLLSGFTGVGGEVGREATAQFESCSNSCTVEVLIPSPFRSVDAQGTGDGYKPIPVGNRLYAINHNSSYGGIVCIDRATETPCWDSVSLPAYAGGAYAQRNPEMPHTAVYGTKIYWTASGSSGTRLFCFDTATSTPCSSSYLINDRDRASSSEISNQKDRNRGGGTVLIGDEIFVFTDDFRVHCVVPDHPLGMQPCSGYEANGRAAALALDNFPTNEPEDGNHGSSIDRIFDEGSGRVYWTTHISEADPPAVCDADNLEFPSGIVSIQNAWSSQFLRVESSGRGIGSAGDNDLTSTHFEVELQGDGTYVFRSVSRGRVLDSDPGNDAPLETSSGIGSDDRWTLDYQDQTSTLQSYYGTYAYDNSSDFVTHSDLQVNNRSNWIIRHPDCFDVGFTPNAPTLGYDSGTWLQCWDAVNDQDCDGFTPTRIHTNGDRFSGRLFFSYDSTPFDPNENGVCSSGFDGSISPSNFEINCVDLNDGLYRDDLSTALNPIETAIANVTDSSPAAWGDPHYNKPNNRLFYPSAHDHSYVLCWDFDYGYCGSVEGWSPTNGSVEDYGFFSEGDCVYGLGHNAVFWAFQADDIYSECTGSTTRTHIEPCACSGEWEWGTITFDVDLSLFDEFNIQVEDSNGDVVYPAPADPNNPNPALQWHSLHDDGITIDLNHLPVSGDPENDFLEILVEVNAENDPWAEGEQTFTVEFARAPRLTD